MEASSFSMEHRHEIINAKERAMLHMIHSSVLALDDQLNLVTLDLDIRNQDNRRVREVLTRLRTSIAPYIDGLANLGVYE